MQRLFSTILFLIVAATAAFGQQIQTVDPKPLHQNLTLRMQPVQAGDKVQVPVITWGADVATRLAEKEGIFRGEGIDVAVFCENDFQKQVQACIDGRTPFVRGTLGMVNQAAEAVAKAGGELVVVYQLSWSNGGDTLTARPVIKSPADLRGRTIALQLYGPHQDYIANIAVNATFRPSDLRYRWFKELTLPTYDTGGKIVDPVSAFRADPSLDGVMCISPDAAALSSNFTVGTGAEGSVKGATVPVTSKTGNRIIADVYAVRRDWLDQNRSKVEGFTRGLFKGEEALRDLRANKAKEDGRYKKLLSSSADLLLGAPQATADVEGLLGDCEFAAFDGNVKFFSGQGTTRNFTVLIEEIQTAFMDMGLMSGLVPLKWAQWDMNAIGKGLKYAGTVAVGPRFDTAKVDQKIAQAELGSWEEGTLFKFEIYFEPG